jgi:alpha-tubulin suppressor-like RCC1 family protein
MIGAAHLMMRQAGVGSLWGWGPNGYGWMLRTGAYYSSPVNVGSNVDWLKVVSSGQCILALKNNHTLWAWGGNLNGELGLGDRTNRSSPCQIGSDNDWMEVAQGQYGNFAIKNNGTLWSWGINSYGGLGHGDLISRSSPTQVGSAMDWYRLGGSGGISSYAIKTDNTLWAWGNNSWGQLGLGDASNRSIPVQVGSLGNWAAVENGQNHSIAIKTNGTLWGMGYNGGIYYVLGLGNSTEYYYSPVQIGSDTDWKQGKNMAFGNLVLKTNGTLWGWGYNSNGELGIGDRSVRSVPTQVNSISSWKEIGGGGATIAIRIDGSLWAWGGNTFGFLGLGDTVSRSSPTQVGSAVNWISVSRAQPLSWGIAIRS